MRCIPYGDFAQEIVLQLQLLHLAVSHSPIFTFEEVLFNLVPRSSILTA